MTHCRKLELRRAVNTRQQIFLAEVHHKGEKVIFSVPQVIYKSNIVCGLGFSGPVHLGAKDNRKSQRAGIEYERRVETHTAPCSSVH